MNKSLRINKIKNICEFKFELNKIMNIIYYKNYLFAKIFLIFLNFTLN